MKKVWLFLSIPLLAASVQIAYAKDLNVNSFIDEVDTSPGDGKCETPAGQCSFRAAIMEANVLAGTDKILLPSGTFTLTRPRIGGEGDEGLDPSGGDLDILDNVEIIGSGKNSTIIDNSILGDRAINFVTDVNNPMTLKLSGVAFTSPVSGMHGTAINLEYVDADIDDIKITDGTSDARVIRIRKGGLDINNSRFENNRVVIWSNDAQLKIRNSVFDSNGADDEKPTRGGGIALQMYSGDAEIDNCEFTNNHSAGTGGAIYAETSDFIDVRDDVLIIRNSQFRNNVVTEGSAGAVFSWQMETLIENSEFTDNQSFVRGGAISFSGSSSTSLTIKSTNFIRNKTTRPSNSDAYGGGALHFSLQRGRSETHLKKVSFIDNQSASDGGAILGHMGPLTMEEVVIRNNIASGSGGGVYIVDTYGGADGDWTQMRIAATEISNNTAGVKGGAIYREDFDDVVIENTTLSGNTASEAGGAIYNRNRFTAYPMLLKNVTIMDNFSSSGSAINNESGPITIVNTVIDQSKGSSACIGEFSSNGGNISDDSTCGLDHASDQSSVSSGLAALNQTSGFTAIHASSSQALTYQNAITVFCPEQDQLLHYRKSLSTCDSGAHQSGAVRSKSGTINFVQDAYTVQRSEAVRLEVSRSEGTEGSVSVVIWDPELGDAERGYDSTLESDGTKFGDYFMGGQYVELNWSDGEGGTKFIDVTTNTKSLTYNGTKSFPLVLIRNYGGVSIGDTDSTRVTIQDKVSDNNISNDSDDGTDAPNDITTQNNASGGGGNIGIFELGFLLLASFAGLRRRYNKNAA